MSDSPAVILFDITGTNSADVDSQNRLSVNFPSISDGIIFGENLSVTSLTTVVLVTYAVGVGGVSLLGFNGSGNGDGKFILQVDGLTKAVCRNNVAQKNCGFYASKGSQILNGSTIELKVTNISTQTTSFEGSLFLG